MEHLSGHVRRIVARQKDIRWRYFFGLAGAPHGNVGTEFGDFRGIEPGKSNGNRPPAAAVSAGDQSDFATKAAAAAITCEGRARSGHHFRFQAWLAVLMLWRPLAVCFWLRRFAR